MSTFKKTILALPVFLFAISAIAQTPPPPKIDPNYDPKAKAILDEVSKTAKGYSSITATFTITNRKADGTTDIKNGNVVMKSGKYKIVLENRVKEKVFKEEYYNDGKTTWVFTEKDGELTIDNAPDPALKKNDNAISPNDIFTIHEKGFKYKFIKEEVKDGRTLQYIDLYPEKPDKKNYSIVKLTIDKAKKQIISVVFQNKDGSTTTYAIKTFTPNLDVTDATFQFDTKTHTVKTKVDMRE